MTRKNRTRALRNLAVAAVLLLAAWIALGAPLPTQTLRMRRAERQNLAERSQIVWRYDAGGDLNDTLVGVTPASVHTYTWNLEIWPRDPDGPTLVILPAELDYPSEEGREQAPALLAVDPPAGAVSAKLTVMLDGYSGMPDGEVYQETYEMDGVREGEVFRFQLTRRHPRTDDPSCDKENNALFLMDITTRTGSLRYFNIPHTLEFFDGDGAVIFSDAVTAGT